MLSFSPPSHAARHQTPWASSQNCVRSVATLHHLHTARLAPATTITWTTPVATSPVSLFHPSSCYALIRRKQPG